MLETGIFGCEFFVLEFESVGGLGLFQALVFHFKLINNFFFLREILSELRDDLLLLFKSLLWVLVDLLLMRFSFNLISHEAHLTTFFRPNYFLHFLPFVLNWLRELHTNNLFLLLFLLNFSLLSIIFIPLPFSFFLVSLRLA